MRSLVRKFLQILDGSPVSHGRKQSGQSVIELAFMTPLLIMLIMGTVEIGWYANNYLTLQEVTRVGARRGAVLGGDMGPLAWPRGATIVPDSLNIWGVPNPDFLMAVNFRQACDTGNPNFLGYYNIVVCTMLSSLDPLNIRQGNDVDDIVVSAFSLQLINNANPNSLPPDSPERAFTYNLTPTRPELSPGYQMVVVGRYPAEANECTVDANGNPIDPINLPRDPFDYIRNGFRDPHPGGNFQQPFIELEGIDTGMEFQRGFAWLGQHRVSDPGLSCWGSEFSVEDVERLMNMPRFGLSNPQRAQLPNQGLVLVEIFWEHALLLTFPLFSPVYEAIGSDTTTLSVWAAFPAPAVEPNIVFN